MRRGICFAIRLYQLISPAFGPHCRFVPSCSDYARQAIARYGVLRGGVYSVRRLLRCQPFSAGGFDPLPSVGPALDQV